MFFSKRIILIITIAIILVVCIFIWIKNISRSEVNIKILIDGSHINPTLLELADGNALEISTIDDGNTNPWRLSLLTHSFFENDNDFLIEEIEWVEFSQRQLNQIRRLTRNIVANGPDREFEWSHIDGPVVYLWAIINGEMYWSLYVGHLEDSFSEFMLERGYINSDLLLLVYELIELSSVPIGGEFNPLQTPRDFY